MAVTLARMEGKLDSVKEKVDGHAAEIVQHRQQIIELQAKTQQLQSDMKGAEASRTLAAAAVKADNEMRVAAAKALVDNSTRAWTPVQRFYATLGALAAVVGILYYLWSIGH
jgi:septal ring factor EnvC (AmiA/AmiB activator)